MAFHTAIDAIDHTRVAITPTKAEDIIQSEDMRDTIDHFVILYGN